MFPIGSLNGNGFTCRFLEGERIPGIGRQDHILSGYFATLKAAGTEYYNILAAGIVMDGIVAMVSAPIELVNPIASIECIIALAAHKRCTAAACSQSIILGTAV